MDGISTFLPFTNIPIEGLKCEVTEKTAEEMLMFFEKICRAMISYSNGSILGTCHLQLDQPWLLIPAVGGLMDERIDEIRSFKGEFNKLKETFRWCLTTEIWKTTLNIGKTKPRADSMYSRYCADLSPKRIIQMLRFFRNSTHLPKLSTTEADFALKDRGGTRFEL